MLLSKLIMSAVGLALCVLAFVPGRRHPAPCFARGVGLQAIIAVFVGVFQAAWVMEGTDFPDLLLMPLVAAPFNMGGLLSAAAFESIDRAGLLSHRQFTVMDNLGVYYPLVAAQVSLGAGVIAARTRATGRVLTDRMILIVLGLALANSVLGITWTWWGS